MAKVSLAAHMKENPAEPDQDEVKAGPFITISRQYGCWGFSLGLMLLDLLNDLVEPPTSWRIYHKEILDKLASETSMDAESLEKQRRTKPRMLTDFFRSLGKDRVPSGYEIRNRITEIIRSLATEGHVIIIGQGGSGATHDLPNGLAVRLEAPEDWRVKQIAFREGLTDTEARLRVRAREQEREYLRKIYEARFPRKPAFNLVYDCSVFPLSTIAQHVVQALKLLKII
ncbi:MAG TPA: cytidylate kinase family protein [Phycisphaerae bacterium]|nr:cytidylate kinase family protein [Phycisphaerae bacterium]